jgi:hypothetical protein
MVNELAAIVQELGGEGVVGRPVRSSQDLSEAIRDGFPEPVLRAFLPPG